MSSEIEAINLSEETSEQRARRILAQYNALSLPLNDVSFKKPTSTTNVTFETAKADNISTTDPRPAIKTSKSTIGYDVVKAISENEKIISDMIGITIKNINFEEKKINELTDEDRIRLQKHIQELSKKYSVDVVKSILTCTASASSIVIGSIFAPNLFLAYLAIMSGAASISNELAQRFGAFEKVISYLTSDETKIDSYAAYAKMVSTASSFAFSLASSIAINPQLTTSLVGKIIDSTLKLSEGIATYVSSMSESTINTIEAEATELKGQLSDHLHQHKQRSNDLTNYAQMQKEFSDAVTNAVLTIIQMNNKILAN